MRINYLRIRNFRAIRDMTIQDIRQALILVGRNSTGKTAVLDALRAVGGLYQVKASDFAENFPKIRITVNLSITEEDLGLLRKNGRVSGYRHPDKWLEDFRKKLPSYKDGTITFTYEVNRSGNVRYADGFSKNNAHIREILPRVYYIDTERNLRRLQDDLLLMQEGSLIRKMRSGSCMFDQAKKCNNCFSCIGLINQKRPSELDAMEAAKLLDYKLYTLNLDELSRSVNRNYRENGGTEEILYSMNRDIEQMLHVTAEAYNPRRKITHPITDLGRGMRSIYMLSLLEAVTDREGGISGIVLVEEPELFLHPQLQKTCGDILYRLSRDNQVIFTTHSPNMLPDFNSREIRQVVLDENGNSVIREHTDISVILDDLGFTANDLMNVDFVFFVEGKQDRSRLPLILKKYYSEIYDEDGKLIRTAIIATNSCTNIKTYANLKYINQVYIRDNFLLIRDSDGRDPEELRQSLCQYYDDRRRDDSQIPRVTEKNVLILRYYSFENYFMNPEIMAKIGVIEKPDDFYRIFLEKWREYLCRLRSGIALTRVVGHDFADEADVKAHLDDIRVYLRGHNLFDIFYGPFKHQEDEILTKYVDNAPREEFADILDAIDRFIYFQNRRKEITGSDDRQQV